MFSSVKCTLKGWSVFEEIDSEESREISGGEIGVAEEPYDMHEGKVLYHG